MGNRIMMQSMSPAMREYRDELYARGLTRDTVTAYTQDVFKFLRDNVLEDLDETTVGDLFHKWIEERKATVSVSTVSRQSGAIRSYIKSVYDIDVERGEMPVRDNPRPMIINPRQVMLPSLISPSTSNWQDDAACTGKTDIMFSNSKPGRLKAKAICESCPSKEPCLEFALANKLDAGTWGGLDEDERKALK